jgi:glucose 1-dehydrogenase
MLTKVLASELAGANIRSTPLPPAWCGPISASLLVDSALCEQIVKAIPKGRIAETAELIPLVLFVASNHGDYITGQTITVDGGASVI